MSGAIQALPVGTMTVASNQAGAFPIAYGYYPAEGSKAVSSQYAWSATVHGFSEDLSQLVAKGVETTIQGVFIDNSTVAGPVMLQINGSLQAVVCPGFSQGVFPLFFTGTPAFSISVASTITAGVTRCTFLNVPCGSAAVWSATATTPALDSTGSALVDTETTANAYSAAVSWTTAIAATDVFVLFGSATKTVRVHEIYLTTANTVAGINIIQRSTPDTGGTPVPVVIASHDQNNPPSTATATIYTASPGVLGAAVAVVDAFNCTPAAPVDRVYGAVDQSLVLRGVLQGLAVNFAGLPAGTVAVNIRVKWTEV